MYKFGFYVRGFPSSETMGEKLKILVSELQILQDQNYHNMLL
jgi:hypothetical protein